MSPHLGTLNRVFGVKHRTEDRNPNWLLLNICHSRQLGNLVMLSESATLESVGFTFLPSLTFQKQRDYTLDGESGKVSNLQYLHR